MKREDVKNLLISEIFRVTEIDLINTNELVSLNNRGIDSLDSVEILMGCEHRLGIDLNLDDFEQVNTFGDAIDILFAIIENLDYPKPKPQKSIINWQTGEPKEGGYYLITTINGKIATDCWRIFPNTSYWEYRNKFDVIAWCPLSEIEPYEES